MGAQHKEIFVDVNEGPVGSMACGCDEGHDHVTIKND
jgi:hypothetical protein